MELVLLGENFEILHMPIDDFTSLQWRRRWAEAGSFELHLSKEFFAAAKAASYLYQGEDADTMMIQAIEYEDDRGDVTLTGVSLSALLGDVIIPRTETLRGTLESEVRRVVKKYAIDGDQKIPKLALGELQGFAETVDTQVTGVSLQEMLYTLLPPKSMSYQLRYDFSADQIFFEVLHGKDRTQDQEENAWAIFSTSRENLLETTYQRDEEDYKNFAYVAGAGEGSSRVIVEVDQTNGERRRAIYVDARDLQPDEGEDVDRWIICGLDGKIATSTDGSSWTQIQTPVQSILYAVSYVNGRYMVAGEEGSIVVSDNGLDWQAATPVTSENIEGALYHDGRYIAVGGKNGGVILTSTDALTWQLQTEPDMEYLRDAIYAKGRYLICGAWSKELLSEDGQSWRLIRLSEQDLWMGDVIYEPSHGIFVGVGRVAGAEGLIMTSSDGEHWQMQQSGVNVELEAVAYGKGLFVAVGKEGVVLTSPDAVTWTKRSSGSTEEYTGIDYGNGLFIVSSWGTTCIKSTDGITWQSFSNPLGGYAGNLGFGTSPYKYRLRQRGMEKLERYQRTETVSGLAAPDALPVFGVDYDLGDKCDFEHPGLGLSFQSIASGVDKVYEAGEHSVSPIFGDQSLTLRQMIEREVDKKA